MKVITIEELEKLAPGEATIVDVRPEEEFRRGTFEGAINIPMKEFSDRMDEIPKDKPVWLLCHTGERSVEYVELLCLSGYEQEMWKGDTVHSCAFSWEDLFPKKTS